MNTLHLLSGGDVGGIEVLCKDYAQLSRHNNIFLFFWTSGIMADEIKALGYDTVELHVKKPQSVLPFFKILKICKQKNIDTLVIQHPAPIFLIYLRLLKLFMPKLKTVAYAHCNASDYFKKKLPAPALKIYERIFIGGYNSADKVIAISKSVKESIVKFFRVPENAIDIVYNGTMLEKYPFCEKKYEDCLTMLYLGRLFPKKGVHNLISACSMLKCDYKCYIVGEGTEYKNLRKIAEESGIADKIIFTGRQRNVSEWHAKADLFVHPAIWEEGFGITLIEAMSSGLPCVAYRLGAIPEIIDDKINGFIIDDISDKSLAKEIEYINEIRKNEPEKWLEIKKNAHKRAADFSMEKMAIKLDEILES